MGSKKSVIISRYPLSRLWLTDMLIQLGCAVEDTEGYQNETVYIVEIAKPEDELILRELTEKGAPVVVYSRLSVNKLLGVLFQFEINGLIHAGMDRSGIEDTMKAAADGEAYFDGTVIAYILSEKYREIFERIQSLSKRELEVIDGILEDLTNDEIADRFGLSVRTVNAHKRNILQKMRERSLVGVIKTILTYSIRFD